MKIPDLDNQTIDRIVEMAWEDRTPFEAIKAQFGLQEKQVIVLIRRSLITSIRQGKRILSINRGLLRLLTREFPHIVFI